MRRGLAIVYAAAFLFAGCSRGSSWLWPFGEEQAGPHAHRSELTKADASAVWGASSTASAHDSSSPLNVVYLEFDILRVDVPAGEVRHTRKLWNHLDELRVNPEQSALLARNGIRMGVASESSWPALQAIFDVSGARLTRQREIIRTDLPLSISLATLEAAETVFCYDRGGRLSGKTIPAGERLVLLDHLLHPELGWCLDLKFRLEIHHDRGVMEWEHSEGVVRQRPAYDRYTFDEVSAFASLSPGEFLVVGPGEEAAGQCLLGSRFFTDSGDGPLVERILCITPRPHQVPAGKPGLP